MPEASKILVVTNGPNRGAEYNLNDEVTIGRSSTNSIVTPLPEISRRHARVWREGPIYYIEDLGSTNGTFVNQHRLDEPVALIDGDELQIGDSFQLLFTRRSSSPSDRYDEIIVEAADIANPALQDAGVSFAQAEIPTPKPPLSTAVPDPSDAVPKTFEESRGQPFWLWCGCLPLVLVALCVGTFFFLDWFRQGQLLYCGPLDPVFQLVLGPFGYSPICP